MFAVLVRMPPVLVAYSIGLISMMQTPSAQSPTTERSLLGEFAGTLPCADCMGIETNVALYGRHPSAAGGTFRSTERYLGRASSDRTFEASGRWSFVRGFDFERDGSILRLNFDHSDRTLCILRATADEIIVLDRECREFDSMVSHLLHRKATGALGGYSVASVFSSDVQDAADFAVIDRTRSSRQSVTLNEIVRAERRIVTGANYRLCLDVMVGGRYTTVLVAVHRDVLQRFSLKHWEVGQCPDR